MEQKTDYTELSRSERIKLEIKESTLFGLSLLVAMIFLNLQIFLIIFFAGRFGQTILSAVGLAMTMQNLTCWAVTAGMTSASETLFAQAYGSPNKTKISLDLQRGLVFIMITFVIAMTIHVNCDVLLVFLGQDPVYTCIARRFMLLTTPGYACFYLCRLFLSYLRVLGVYWPIIGGPAAGCLTIVVLSYALTDYGMDGIAFAVNVAFFVMLAICVGYTFWSRIYVPTWQPWSLQVFANWGQLFQLSIAGIALSTSEYMFTEILTLLAGTMDAVSLAAQVVVTQIYSLSYAVSFSFGLACAIRVGILLGANQPDQARIHITVNTVYALVVQTIVTGFLVIFRYPLVGLFTTDSQTIQVGAKLMLIFGLEEIAAAIYKLYCGALKGAGKQGISSVANIICMYVIGVPILVGTALGFGWGIIECWIIFTATFALLALVFYLLVKTLDMKKEADLAQERSMLKPTKDYDYAQFDLESGVLKQRGSFTQIMGQSSSQASRMNLRIGEDEPTNNLRHLALKRSATAALILLGCAILQGMNFTGLLSVESMFGHVGSFVNSTSVVQCAHFARS